MEKVEVRLRKMYEINTKILLYFIRRFEDIFNKRKIDWNMHIYPIFRYLKVRVNTCKATHLDTYEYLVNEACITLSNRFHKLQDKIDSATEEILEQIKKRRDEAESMQNMKEGNK